MAVMILRIIVICYSSKHDNNDNGNNVKDALENFQDQGNYNIIVH